MDQPEHAAISGQAANPNGNAPGTVGGPDIPHAAVIVSTFNAQNAAHHDLWERILHARDSVRDSVEDSSQADRRAREAHDAHLSIRAEHPRRRAPRLRQLLLAGSTVIADAIACYFAAQALGDAQAETVLWTALFLAVLAGGEVALDYYHDHRPRVWRVLTRGLAVFIIGLGVLRYDYLATVGDSGTLAPVVGACLFTLATAAFVCAGYRALLAAESSRAWKARRMARKAAREAANAAETVTECVNDQNRLVDAYLVRMKAAILRHGPVEQLEQIETAVRTHLTRRGARS